MFTGIIEATGTVVSLMQVDSEWRLALDTGKLNLADVKIGDSIAVSGCCLTVIELGDKSFAADVSNETLRCTTLGDLRSGSRVNLEKAMQATDRFGGHIVSGHVDGVGKLLGSTAEGKSWKLEFEVSAELARYIAAKGSICIDGTSLTVNEVKGAMFTINVIAHTQDETVIGGYQKGQRVNIEVDLVARYLERLVQGETAGSNGKIDKEFLQQHGFQSS
jgi:riboflavin synthase